LIFHGFDLDDECIAAMLKSGSFLCPTLTHPRNMIDFTQPNEPAALKGRVEANDPKQIEEVAMIIRACGHSTTETLVATPWKEFPKSL
jgi:hypothetical protein